MMMVKRRIFDRVRNALTLAFGLIYLIPLYMAVTNSF